MQHIRIGTVAVVNEESGNVRMVYGDHDDDVSPEVPILNFKRGVVIPRVGDIGICLIPQPNARGIYLGSIVAWGDDDG